MTRETDISNLSGIARFNGCAHPAPLENPFRIVIVIAFVEHPQIEVIRPEAPQTVFETGHGTGVIPLTVLRHEENLLALPVHGERAAHHLFGEAVVIIPGVIEEVNAFADGGVHESNGVGFGMLIESDTGNGMPASQRDDRYRVFVACGVDGKGDVAIPRLGESSREDKTTRDSF